MKYVDSITEFFRSPKWGLNLLFGAICTLIPYIGPMVITGWLITLFWAKREHSNTPETYPPFDFQFFSKYLERALWPFVVSLVASVVLIPVVFVFMFVFMILAAMADGNSEVAEFLLGISFILGFVAYLLVMIAFSFAVVPLILKATITQNFKSSFDFQFMKSFLSLVWKEMLISILFLFGVGIVASVIGIATCYIGFFAVAPILTFSWVHLQKQLYMLYLERGGEEIPLSEKLIETPPALPQS